MAVLEREIEAGSGANDLGPRMTIVEHLEALRRVLIISFSAWLIATLGSFFFYHPILKFLMNRAGIPHLYYTSPLGAVMLGLQVGLAVGFFISSPVIIQQAWWFVSPGLHRNERRLMLPLIIATLIFFWFGVAFALVSVPLMMKVLSSFAGDGLVFWPHADDFLGFMLAVTIGYGLVFELPVVLYVLGRLRIISSKWLYKNRVYWVIGLGVAAQVLTPGTDPFTPFLMFVPLLVFWEGTTLLLKLTGR